MVAVGGALIPRIARISGALGFVSLCRTWRGSAGGDDGMRRPLGLERLQRAQRPPELGEWRRDSGPGCRTRVLGCNRGSARGRGSHPRGDSPRTARPLGRRVGERGPNPVPAAKRSARSRRQVAATIRRASVVWSAPSGASSSIIAASSALNAALSSSGRTTYVWAQSPCLSAFCADRALPAGVLGPRDLAPLRRLASARALDRPKLDMSKIPSLGRVARLLDVSLLLALRA